MRASLLTSAVVLSLSLAAPAFAYTNYGPMPPSAGFISPQAYNLPPSDYAPARPLPRIGPNAGMHTFLGIARHALAKHRIGLAQDALVRAISARSHLDERAGFPPGHDRAVFAIQAALNDLVAHRFMAVDRRIAEAMAAPPVRYGRPVYNRYGMRGQ
jgi:hypothetical protein